MSVLVIEPFADLRLEIAATLLREHYSCSAVATAEEGAAALQARPYSYLVVDHDSVGDYVKAVGPSSHIIVLTEDDSEDARGYATLRKPFSRDELMKRLMP